MPQTGSSASTPKTWPRLRFGVRGLLILTAAVGLASAAVVALIAPYRMQREALAELERGSSMPYISSKVALSWLVDGFFNETFHVECDEGNTDLRILQRLPFLRRCGVHGRKLATADIQLLASLERLTDLDLAHCEISEDDVSLLGRLKNLETLNVQACGLSEGVLDELRAALPNLEIYDD